MQDFINMAVQQLGINEQSAKSATGGLLGMIQKNSSAGDFGKLTNLLPGSGDLLHQFGGGAAAPAHSGGGLGALGGALGGMLGGHKGGGGGGLGNLAAMATGALGGNAGGAGALLGLLGNSGISADKAGGFLNLFMNYVKGKGGEQLLGPALGKLPDLAKLLG